MYKGGGVVDYQQTFSIEEVKLRLILRVFLPLTPTAMLADKTQIELLLLLLRRKKKKRGLLARQPIDPYHYS